MGRDREVIGPNPKCKHGSTDSVASIELVSLELCGDANNQKVK